MVLTMTSPNGLCVTSHFLCIQGPDGHIVDMVAVADDHASDADELLLNFLRSTTLDRRFRRSEPR